MADNAADDADAAAVLSRCRATSDRAATGTVESADVATFVADLAGLPAGHPERSRLAATMVIALTKGGGAAPIELMRYLNDLLLLVDFVPPSLAIWPQVRAVARAQYLMHAVKDGQLVDLPAAEKELAGLVEVVWEVPSAKFLVEGAQRGVAAVAAARSGEEGAMRKLLMDFSPQLDQLGDHPAARTMRSCADLMQQLVAAGHTGDLAEATRLLGLLEEKSAELPAHTGIQEACRQTRAQLGVLTGAFDGTRPGGDPRRAADRMAQSLTGPESSLADKVNARLVAAAGLFRGGEETDLARIDVAVDQFREALALGDGHDQYPFVLTSLALGLFRRAEVTGTTEGLAEAECHLVRALELLGGPQHQHWAFANELLAAVRQRGGDLAAATEFGKAAQRSYVWRALVESEADDARVAVREAVRGATELARTCLGANKIADALLALDTCRGLILFAEVELRNVPTRLVAAGRADLADRWVREGRKAKGLRREVMTTLVASAESAGSLLDPPGLGEIQAALAIAGADALVYLVPGGAAYPGLAVIAPREGPPAYLALGNLVIEGDTDVEHYFVALVNRSREVTPVDAGSFDDSLDTLCDWAWRAAIGPLLDRYFARTTASENGRVPRLVLVPMGDLARIPWQAARRADGTYAVQLAAFSQAVSARLFCDNAAKPPIAPTSTGLFVGDPDTNGAADPDAGGAARPLAAASGEAYAIRQAFYLGARYLGRRPDGSLSPSGRGTAREVRDWLADAEPYAGTTLHLACHGSFVTDESGVRAALLLAPDRPDGTAPGELGADEILRVLAAVPERELGLVVTAACHTDRSVHGYDEAYSLGTAFLAGGARTVLSTQWAIPDEVTSSLMFMFHHCLREERLAPWEALRRAQMWMLDPHREPLDSMPAGLLAMSAGHDHAAVVAWAGFVHGGQ